MYALIQTIMKYYKIAVAVVPFAGKTVEDAASIVKSAVSKLESVKKVNSTEIDKIDEMYKTLDESRSKAVSQLDDAKKKIQALKDFLGK